MARVRNVVVFGDSLSDIGTKWKQAMGRFASAIGEMTTSPTGRFSDCRNWTDFMYEEASGRSLIAGTCQDSINASKLHQSFSSHCLVGCSADPSRMSDSRDFHYANYGEGGACGGIPKGGMRAALGTFKDQVKKFREDWEKSGMARRSPNDKATLFLVWFGANDLYTCGCEPGHMSDVATKVASKRRDEVVQIVGGGNAHFIFVNLPRPETSFRYQLWQLEDDDGLFAVKNKAKTVLNKAGSALNVDRRFELKKKVTRKQFNDLARGADFYNGRLYTTTRTNSDGYVDMASAVAPDTINKLLAGMGLIGGSMQEEGTSKTYISSRDYDRAFANPGGDLSKKAVSSSDMAHPTDRVYKYMWQTIKAVIQQNGYNFGMI